MRKSKKRKPGTARPSESLSTGEMPEQSAKDVHVEYRRVPSPLPPGQKIHDRKELPTVPEGKQRGDDTPTPPVELE